MTEKEIITKIKQLRKIQARPQWVSLTKSHILDKELGAKEGSSLFFLFLKPGLAGFTVLIMTAVFIFSQAALPGELLYPLKKLTETSQGLFMPEQELPRYELEKANKRLEEITKVVGKTEQSKKVESKRLEPVIKEFKENVAQAAKILVKTKATSSDPIMVKKIVEETRKLEENKQVVEKLGVKIGQTKELDEALALIVLREIEKLEQGLLTEEREQALEEVKQDYEQGNYATALEKVLLLSYPQR